MAKLQKAEQEQKNIMAQEINIIRTRQGVEWKDFDVLKLVSSSGTVHNIIIHMSYNINTITTIHYDQLIMHNSCLYYSRGVHW